MIARAPGGEQWLTGEEARRFGHFLRATHDAILVGSGTVLADDPDLTCRIAGLEDRSPLRVVLDGRLRMPPGAKLVRTASAVPVIVYTAAEGGEGLRAAGVEVVRLAAGADGGVDLRAVLHDLAERGITRLLVEGGAAVAQGFLDRGLADRLEIFRSPVVAGAGGRAAPVFPLENYTPAGTRQFGPDRLERYERREMDPLSSKI